MNNQKAFTLIEVLIVTAILAVLAVTATTYYGDAREEANSATTRRNLSVIREAIGRYFKDRMQYPTDLSALQGPYLEQTPSAVMSRSMGGASWAFVIEVPNTEDFPGVSPNAFIATSFREIRYDPSGPKNRQFRKLRVKIDDTVMPW